MRNGKVVFKVGGGEEEGGDEDEVEEDQADDEEKVLVGVTAHQGGRFGR